MKQTRARVRRGLLIATLAVVPAIAAFAIRNPIFFEMPVRVVQYESFRSLSNLVGWVYYFHTYVTRMRWNPERGQKDFAEAANELFDSDADPDLLEVGKMYWHLGDFGSAVNKIEAYHGLHDESEESVFWLALSYMRLAESKNCLDRLLDESDADPHQVLCTLPLDAHHRRQVYSRKAAGVFEKLLNEYDPDDRVYQWLLNFSYMTVDGYPHEVPQQYQLGANFVDYFHGETRENMERKYEWLRLRDRAKEFGIDKMSTSPGLAVEDFNRDGYLDAITGGSFTSVSYFENDGGKGFIDKSDESGLSKIRGTHIMSAADYDNDGWMDVFISRPFGSRLGDFVLMRNNRDGTFTDVTVSSGLLKKEEERDERALAWASLWGDIDNDGDLDLFVGLWSFYNGVDSSTYITPFTDNMQAVLYRNDEGSFTDVTKEYGLDKIVRGRSIFGGAFGDFDGDGYIDMALTPMWVPSAILIKNEGGKRFVETDLLESSTWGFMASFLDYNHDGLLDLYVGGSGSAYGVTEQTVFGESFDTFNNETTLWIQQADGSWEGRPDYFTGNMPMATMGTSFGDLNNDGAYDFYLGTGSPEGWLVLPNLMFMGQRENGVVAGPMDNISMLNDLGSIQKGHGIVFFDFDEDGDQDLYSSLGGMWPGDAWPDQFFVNESKLDNSWLKIRLRGRESNRFGVGARIKVVSRNESGDLTPHYYYMTNKTVFGSAPYLAHMGLADAVAVERVEVTWPGKLSPAVYSAELNTTVVLDEKAASVLTAAKPAY